MTLKALVVVIIVLAKNALPAANKLPKIFTLPIMLAALSTTGVVDKF